MATSRKLPSGIGVSQADELIFARTQKAWAGKGINFVCQNAPKEKINLATEEKHCPWFYKREHVKTGNVYLPFTNICATWDERLHAESRFSLLIDRYLFTLIFRR